MSREVLKMLEDIYITSRYLPSPCTQEDAKTLIKLVENLIQFIGKILRSECTRELLQS